MDKTNFKKLALLGIAGGMIMTAQAPAHANVYENNGTLLAGCGAHCSGKSQPRNNSGDFTADASDSISKEYPNIVSSPMTEDQLLGQLNAEGLATYKSLSPEGKALALKLASQTCKGQNDCKGLNSCKTSENSCAGTGSCKGKTPGPFTDKNKAVKAAAKKMAEKRSAYNSNY